LQTLPPPLPWGVALNHLKPLPAARKAEAEAEAARKAAEAEAARRAVSCAKGVGRE
jgi:hypothetical protein